MAYTIKYQKQAVEDAKKLFADEPKAFQKLFNLPLHPVMNDFTAELAKLHELTYY